MRLNTKDRLCLRVVAFTALAVTIPVAWSAPPATIAIPGERVFPESLTSTSDGTIIIGSIGTRTIFRVKPGASTAEPWIQPETDGLQSVFGVFADEKSRTLWACSNSFGPPAAAAPTPATLYAFDLKTGSPKSHYPFPTARAFCNDIAIGPDGTAYATDTNNMEIVRLKKGAKELEVWAGNGVFGPGGGVLDGISVAQKHVWVNTLATSKLFSVAIRPDGSAGSVTEIKLDRPIERPDGMRNFGKNDLLVVEGGGGGRLSRVTLNGHAARVSTLKEGFPDGPVSVALIGRTGYVLEGQLAAMRAAPDVTAKLKPFHATAVEVGTP